MLYWGLLWWLFGVTFELRRTLSASELPGVLLALAAVTALSCGALHRRLKWQALLSPALLLLPVMVFASYHWYHGIGHPLSGTGALGWPVALASLAFILHRNDAEIPAALAAWLHPAALWLLAALAGWELSYQVNRVIAGSSAWSSVAVALVPAALVAWILGARQSDRWPIASQRQSYLIVGAGGLLAFLGLWSLHADWRYDGNAAPLPYVPLINPLDLAEALALLLGLRWMLYTKRSQELAAAWHTPLTIALVALAFIWLNTVLLRTLHHWQGVPYNLEAQFSSTLVQSSLSIFWTLLALATMLWAHRVGKRIAWIAAALLMGIVVAKLFLLDLASVGTIARIVSFIVVGALMLVIGYYSPLPPAAAADRSKP
jgi:uncharacterized membrane protein